MKHRQSHIGLLALLLIVLTCMVSQAQDRLESVLGRMEARMLQAEKEDGFSGVVLVGKGDRVLLHKAYGWADPFVKVRNSGGNRYMIASISKSFAAAAILQLEDKGLLRTQDTIAKYLPDYPTWASSHITIHQLLTHTSGIPDYINDSPIGFRVRRVTGWEPDKYELVEAFQERPLHFYPGERFKYSNSGYVLLARIVEEVSGMDFNTYLQRNIFEPLGMEETGLGEFDHVGNRAVAFKKKGKKEKPIRNFKPEWIYGMGEAYSTAPDLNKWLMSFQDTLILSETAKEKMFTPEKSNYAYGWHVYDMHGRRQFSHGGYLPGWNSYVFYYPEDSLSIVVLSNVEHADPLSICSNLSQVLYMNRIDDMGGSRNEKYAGRYEMLDGNGEVREAPFMAEIVTVNGAPGSLKVKTAGGKTMQFVPLESGEWEDPREDMKLKFKETGGSVLLQVSKGGHQWRWRKLSGDYYSPAVAR